jgi:hypothetical protein
MAIFKLKAISKAEDDETVQPKYQSQIHYYSYCERSFSMLSDETTIIGVEKGNGEKVFVMEDISNKDPYYKPFKMEFHTNDIDCILVNEKMKAILVGDRLGRLNQYSFDVNKNKIEITREYGLMNIGYIYSGVFMGKLAILGGNKTYSLRVVNMESRQIFGDSMETAFFGIHSLQLCQVSDENVYLSICGVNPDYSTNSDIYNAKELLKYHKIKLPKIEMDNKSKHQMATSQCSLGSKCSQDEDCNVNDCSDKNCDEDCSGNKNGCSDENCDIEGCTYEKNSQGSQESCWLCSSTEFASDYEESESD